MRAMVLDEPKRSLELRDVPKPKPAGDNCSCASAPARFAALIFTWSMVNCPIRNLPLILGHQIVGQVEEIGEEMWERPEPPDSRGTKAAPTFGIGDRVGIPWLGWTDGDCAYCRSGRENLCDNARFTGYTIDGGYAEFTVADARFCFHLPDQYNDIEAAPLLCAGLIGYRSYRKAGNARRLGMYGFGNAAHLIAQIAIYEGRELFAFTRSGDKATQQAAKELGARVGRRFRRNAAGKTRCRNYFCIRWPACTGSAPHARERRHCGLRRNHMTDTIVSLCQSMGRARDYVSGQPDAARR